MPGVPGLGRPAGFMAVAAALIAAAGCGGSDSGATTTTISKAAFVAKANAICTKGNAESNALAGKTFGNKQPTQAQLERFAKAQVPLIQRQIDQIRALGAPSGDEATVKQMLDIAQGDLNKLESNPALVQNQKLFANFVEVARPYGLTACAQGS